MAVTSAAAVANLYYNQPLLAVIAQSFHASAHQVGFIPMLTQLGYACGATPVCSIGRLDGTTEVDCYNARDHRSCFSSGSNVPEPCLVSLWLA